MSLTLIYVDMELPEALSAWIAEEEAKWAAEVAAEHDGTMLPDPNPSLVQNWEAVAENNNGMAIPSSSNRTTLPDSSSSPAQSLEVAAENNSGTMLLDPNSLRCWDHGCDGRQFFSKSNLYRHQRENRWKLSTSKPSGTSRQPRPTCWDHGCRGRPFSTYSNLYRHQRERRWDEEAVCPSCGTRFTPVLAEIKPSQELRCWEHGCEGRTFPTRGGLYRHQRHKLAREATCPNPHCGKVFVRR